METEVIINTIKKHEQKASYGNTNLLNESEAIAKLMLIKKVIAEYDEGERDLEKLEKSLQMMDEIKEHIGLYFGNLKKEIHKIFEYIDELKSPIKNIMAMMDEKKYNINELWEIIVKAKEHIEDIINSIDGLDAIFPELLKVPESSASCVVFELALIQFKLKKIAGSYPENISILETDTKQVYNIINIVSFTVIDHKDNDLNDLIARINSSETSLVSDATNIEEQFVIAINKLKNH